MLPLPPTRVVTSESPKLEKLKVKRGGLPKTKLGCRTCKWVIGFFRSSVHPKLLSVPVTIILTLIPG
jgi:hypothetical protein